MFTQPGKHSLEVPCTNTEEFALAPQLQTELYHVRPPRRGGHIECAARGRPLLHRRRGGHSREPDRRVGGAGEEG